MNEFRKMIDECDNELILLLKRRMKLAKEIGVYKKDNNLPICVPEREKELIARLKRMSDDNLSPEAIEGIFTEIIKASKNKQMCS